MSEKSFTAEAEKLQALRRVYEEATARLDEHRRNEKRLIAEQAQAHEALDNARKRFAVMAEGSRGR